MFEEGLKLLASQDIEEQCRGVELLGESGRAEAIEHLARCLPTRSEPLGDALRETFLKLKVAPTLGAWYETGDVDQQLRALQVAVYAPDPDLVELAGQACSADSVELRKLGVIALKQQVQHAQRALQHLKPRLQDADEDIRWHAIDALYVLGHPDGRPLLQAALESEPDQKLQYFIRRALDSLSQ